MGVPVKKERFESLWFWLGVAAMTLTIVPNLILGENSIFTYHDQLDGEMIAYLLQARHLFSGDLLPEFMGGMSKTALTMPAPISVLLFLGGNGLAALIFMQLVGRVAGFVGMYLLSREMTDCAWASAGAGVLYGLLPFLPVYGLSQYGIPLLVWCVLQLRKEKHLVLSYCCVAFFGLASSLVLVGFGLLGMGALVLVWDALHKRRIWHFLAAWQLLLGVYVAENFRLLFQLFGAGGGELSHKAEYTLEAQPFWGALWRGLAKGIQHGEGYHGGAVAVILAAVALALAGTKAGRKLVMAVPGGAEEPGVTGPVRCLRACLGGNLFLSLAAALWDSAPGVWLRGFLGSLGAFQMDRILWMAPCFWYLAAACGLAVLWRLLQKYRGVSRLLAGGCLAASAVAVGVTGLWILYSGDLKSNIQKLRNPDYGLLSYGEYYAVGVMEQVREFLEEQTGKTQAEYRVVSLGIDPAAALYHGFYCLDGYSNNYSLDYKHKFREIILPELEKSDYLKNYFDNWGNRCYLFSAECPGYYTIEKNGFQFQNYQLNREALRGMGCDYLLSAAYIQNSDSQGLRLMNEIPFETEQSYYSIYVYDITGSSE